MSSEEEAVSREVAWRVFAREYDDADFAFKEGEDERAPNYVATPTGAKINRLFVVGVLTEVERVGEGDLLRARVSDPTGAFVVYAGQYQPDAVSFLADAETPEFVAVVGKARTYEPEDSDDVYTSIRPEEINVVDAETRDRWNVETARETLRRIEATREYLRNGVTPETHPELHELGEVVDHYATDEAYLNELEREARDVLTEVAGAEAAEVGTGTDGTTAPDKAEGAAANEARASTEETPEAQAETGGDTEISVEEATAETDDKTVEAEPEETDDATDGSEDDFSDIEQEDIGDDEEVGDWEWDEGQREEVEEEFGAEFETGAEFAEEEETEEPEEAEEEDAEDTEEVEKEAEITEADDEEEESKETEQEEETDESAETVVMNIIEDESGDDGVERSQIVAKATESGLEEDVAEATLEDLLLEGMCYPTDGDRIKPI